MQKYAVKLEGSEITIIEPHSDDAWLGLGGFILLNPQLKINIITICQNEDVYTTKYISMPCKNVKTVCLHYPDIPWGKESREEVNNSSNLIDYYVKHQGVVVNLSKTKEKALNIALNSKAIAGEYTEAVSKLLDEIKAQEPAIYDELRLFEVKPEIVLEQTKNATAELLEEEDNPRVKMMDLQPFEHYDYAMIFCKNTQDWMWLMEFLKLERVDAATHHKTSKIGLGRGITIDKFKEALRNAGLKI